MLQEYALSRDHRLDSSSQSRLQMTYRKSVRSSSDPYKKAVYCLLACCDFNDNHPDVIQKTDDYIWYKVGAPPHGAVCVALPDACGLTKCSRPHSVESMAYTRYIPGIVDN